MVASTGTNSNSKKKTVQKKTVSTPKSEEESKVVEVTENQTSKDTVQKNAVSPKTKSANVAATATAAVVEKVIETVVDTPKEDVVTKPTESSESDTDVEKEKDSKESIESVFLTKLSTFVNKVTFINKEVKELQTLGKTLEKEFNAVVKVLSKQKNKTKNTENRTLSGFAMPSLLSNELYEFLNIEKGTLIPRKDVTKLINEYIKSNNLRNEEDKRKIIPDESLKKIFKCGSEDMVTYFNLQTYMKHHFIKDTSKLNTTVVVS